MAHPQNSYRGSHAKQRYEVSGSGSNSTAVLTADTTGNLRISKGLALSGETTDIITQNSTAVLIPAQLRVDAARYIGANSTGYLLTSETGLPATDGGNYKLTLVVDSTGVAGLALNTTGATWKYFKMTSTINTT